MTNPRLSHQALRVLHVLLENPRRSLAGSDICNQTGMLSGTIYPILIRLQRAGWLVSDWEQLDPKKAGRPRKRLYHLTDLGYNKARRALTELTVPEGSLVWN